MQALFKEINRLSELTEKKEKVFSYENTVKHITIDRMRGLNLSKGKNQRLMNKVIKEVIAQKGEK